MSTSTTLPDVPVPDPPGLRKKILTKTASITAIFVFWDSMDQPQYSTPVLCPLHNLSPTHSLDLSLTKELQHSVNSSLLEEMQSHTYDKDLRRSLRGLSTTLLESWNLFEHLYLLDHWKDDAHVVQELSSHTITISLALITDPLRSEEYILYILEVFG